MTFTFDNPRSVTVVPLIPDADQPLNRTQNLTRMLIDPLMAAGPKFTDNQGTVHTIPAQALHQLLDIHRGTAANPVLRAQADDALTQALEHYQGCELMNNDALFIHQSAHRLGLQAPSRGKLIVEYSAQYDIIPEAVKLMKQGGSTDPLFVSIGYTYAPRTLGVSVADDNAFIALREKIIDYIKTIRPVMTPSTARAIKDFAQITLEGLGETLLLRSDLSPNLHPDSFASLLLQALRDVVPTMDQDQHTALMPFSVNELIETRTVTFININAHAQTEPKVVRTFWGQINTIHARKLNLVRIETMRRASKMAVADKLERSDSPVGRHDGPIIAAEPPKFRMVEPTQIDLARAVTRLSKRIGRVRMSKNPQRYVTETFARPNRRAPDDPNRKGIITVTAYAPDFHIYVDRSASIREQHWLSSLITVIKLAKKLNVDLYYSTFSHYLSEPTLIRVRGRSVSSIYRQIISTPAASGWTDLSLMWDAINASPQRQKQLSLMITDFDWEPDEDQQRIPHPKNLYYTPCSNMEWDTLVYYAGNLCNAMSKYQPYLAQRMIGMTV